MFLSYVTVQCLHASYLTALCSLFQVAVRLKENHVSLMLKTALNSREPKLLLL